MAAAMTIPAAAQASTFVYVSSAEAGTIGLYTLQPDGTLKPGDRFDAGAKPLAPMSVSPDKRFLVAAVRSRPFTAVTFAIDPKTGALKKSSTGPLHESFPYIRIDPSGHFLLAASYSAHLVSVNAIDKEGKVAPPHQVIPTGRHAHAIITDNTGQWVFVPCLGTDQIFQFRLDRTTGKLAANTPPAVQLMLGTGPRHIIMSPDNKFAYLLNELTGTVTTLSLDVTTGLLTEVANTSILPLDSKLGPGAPRLPPVPGQTPKDVSNDIWASDLHITPNGKFLYAAERTTSSIAALQVDAATGKLTWLSITPTEKQPRGFQIDPNGKALVATGEKSDTISVYAIDGATGALQFVHKYPTGKGSSWVEIVRF